MGIDLRGCVQNVEGLFPLQEAEQLFVAAGYKRRVDAEEIQDKSSFDNTVTDK